MPGQPTGERRSPAANLTSHSTQGPDVEAHREKSSTDGWWTAGILTAVSGAAFYGFTWTRVDPDLWGHVLFGQLKLETGGVTHVEPFSYLATDWINHEWLAEVVFGFVYNILGPAGLVGLKAAVGMLLFAVVYRLLSKGSLDVLRGGIGALFVTWLLYVGTRPVRPQLFTYLMLMATLLVLSNYERTQRKALLLLLPPVFILWTNFHGGFLAGLGVLFIWCSARLIADFVRQASVVHVVRQNGALLGASTASLLATLVNPYGIDLLTFVLRTATVPRPEITEWAPVEMASIEGVMYLGFLVLVGVVVARGHHRMSAPALATLAVTALLPLLAIRHLPLFGIAGAVLVGPYAGIAFRRSRARAERPTAALHRGAALVAGGAGVAFLALSVPNFGCIHVGPPNTEPYPTGAVRVLQDAGVSANLAVFFNWGEYVIWHLGPRVQVSMDGRRETVYPDSIYREYADFMLGRDEWDAVLERRPTDAALVPKGYPVFNLLRLKPGWDIAYEDGFSALFVPQHSPMASAIHADGSAVRGEGPATWCFP